MLFKTSLLLFTIAEKSLADCKYSGLESKCTWASSGYDKLSVDWRVVHGALNINGTFGLTTRHMFGRYEIFYKKFYSNKH